MYLEPKRVEHVYCTVPDILTWASSSYTYIDRYTNKYDGGIRNQDSEGCLGAC